MQLNPEADAEARHGDGHSLMPPVTRSSLALLCPAHAALCSRKAGTERSTERGSLLPALPGTRPGLAGISSTRPGLAGICRHG